MSDKLKRYIHQDGQFKIITLEATGIGQDIFKKCELSPIALQLVTQAMCGALMLTAGLKNQATLMFRFGGDGPAESITVEANTLGQVRGTLGNPLVHFEPRPELGLFQQAIGAGNLSVRRKSDPSEKVFSSVVPLVDGEIAFNFAYYLLQSEQISSAIQMGAALDADLGVKGAGGVLIQAMPGANENLLFILEQRLAEMDSMGKIFSEPNPHETLMNWLCDDMPYKELGAIDVSYHCGCTLPRMLQMLSTLPLEDLQDLVSKREAVEVNCSFCNNAFKVSPEDFDVLIDLKQNPA